MYARVGPDAADPMAIRDKPSGTKCHSDGGSGRIRTLEGDSLLRGFGAHSKAVKYFPYFLLVSQWVIIKRPSPRQV